ncbi:MAG: hypothetical protein K2X93_24090 [Candidatus Obscuribacterales bacterium]|nr:hypothetical protein [Candidatus Obscuribacterales bacterium]
MILGEAKTYKRFEDADFRRADALVDAFNDAAIVFASFNESLDDSEKASLSELANRGAKLVILTGNELLNSVGAPYCWYNSGNEEVRSLVSNPELDEISMVSRVTRILYLG